MMSASCVQAFGYSIARPLACATVVRQPDCGFDVVTTSETPQNQIFVAWGKG